uniref:Pentatricopeptide repeat-containing protein At1g11290 n=1 Tax=Anthurium amnicola TaxID=1678845 RepID=A0A1D1Z767_9ARAE
MLRRSSALHRFHPRSPAPATATCSQKRCLVCCPETVRGPECGDEEFSHLVPIHWRGSSSPATPYDFVRIITASTRSSSLCAGEQAHTLVVKLGLLSNTFVCSALVDLYCKCQRMADAQLLFDEMTHRNVVSWNSLIRGYSQAGFPVVSVRLFVEMMAACVSPSPFSVSSVLFACSSLTAQEIGAMVHCVAVKCGFCSNVVVGTSLVDMYSKCCSDMSDSRRMFDEMHERNVVTWTSLVTGYAAHQRPDEAMVMVNQMRVSGIKLNEVTYSSLLSSFLGYDSLDYGRQVHCLAIRQGLESYPYVAVSLTSMYSKCGSVEDFVKIFHIVSTPDQVLHNSVIAGFSHLGNLKEVLDQFTKMRQGCIDVDYYTFASLLRAIGIGSALKEGKQTHALVFKSGHASDTCVQNGLVAMYARCGTIDDSKLVFSSINRPDLVSWNALISGCAQHGHGRDAIELFEQMRSHRVNPDNTTYLSLLSACSHVGLLDKGMDYFKLMTQKTGSVKTPEMEHYSSMVDLLGRAGCLNEAEFLVNNMPIKPGPSIYRSLLSACHVHGDMEMATRVAERLLELCPDDSATYVLLSNVLANRYFWNASAIVRKHMVDRGVKKKPGWSCIERQ